MIQVRAAAAARRRRRRRRRTAVADCDIAGRVSLRRNAWACRSKSSPCEMNAARPPASRANCSSSGRFTSLPTPMQNTRDPAGRLLDQLAAVRAARLLGHAVRQDDDVERAIGVAILVGRFQRRPQHRAAAGLLRVQGTRAAALWLASSAGFNSLNSGFGCMLNVDHLEAIFRAERFDERLERVGATVPACRRWPCCPRHRARTRSPCPGSCCSSSSPAVSVSMK